MLDQFLKDLARKPFTWGETDCALTLGDWWRMNHGVDPAQHLRGTYATEAECELVYFREGCLPRLVDRLARSVGAPRTRDPKPGDFAVLRLEEPLADRWWSAIMTPSGHWAIKCRDGLTAIHPRAVRRVVAAWAIG